MPDAAAGKVLPIKKQIDTRAILLKYLHAFMRLNKAEINFSGIKTLPKSAAII